MKQKHKLTKIFKSVTVTILMLCLLMSSIPITNAAQTKFKSFSIDDVEIIQFTNGYYTEDYDGGKDEYIEWYNYDYSSKIIGTASDKGRFKDLVTYYQLTQLTANGAESYSVERNGWHTQSLNKRLSDFLKKFKQDAERSQNEKKPFVLSFSYKHNNDVSGHSVVVCGYNYNDSTNEHEILIYDENTYPNVRYFIFKISSDYSSFTFTDANGEALGYMISDIWTNLEVYDIDKLYSGKNFSSISVVKGSEPVSASNTTQLNITAYKTFKVVNDRGEYLEYDGSSYNGNMNVYDCKLVDNLDNTCSWDITVNNSSKFVFSNLENDCEIIGETYSGGFYICSNYSDGFTINGKSVTVEGKNYDFDIALQTQSEKDFIRVSGKASGNTSVSDNSNTIEIKSDPVWKAANELQGK